MGQTVEFQKAMAALQCIAAPIPPWQHILGTARDLVRADVVSFMVFGKDRSLLGLEQAGSAVAQSRQPKVFLATDTVANPALVHPAGTFFESIRKMPPGFLAQARSGCTGQGSRQHIDHALAFMVACDGFRQVGFSFQRCAPAARAPCLKAQKTLLQYILCLTAALEQRRNTVLAHLEAIDTTLTGLGEASLLATGCGHIWHLSTLATQWLGSAQMIATPQGALTHGNPAVAQRLRHAIDHVACSGHSTTLAVPAGWGEVLHLDIGPAHASLKLGGENILFIRMRKNSAFAAPRPEALCMHFGLTPAEARVLGALLSGHSSNEYASSSGLAQRTVRNHIAALMRKMGCSRQAELVRLGTLLA